jgi:2-polyprenyl-3-methyl-5-hydroxy-6-metoxy-1,4-benzoquinol methylase
MTSSEGTAGTEKVTQRTAGTLANERSAARTQLAEQADVAGRNCDICGATLAIALASVRDPQTKEKFRILRCPSCGLGHTSPQPADLGPYYGAQYHGGRHGVTDRMCMARRLGFLRDLGRTRGRLLDFGCGDGSFLLAAHEAGFTGEGIEMNPLPARARGVRVHEQLDALAAHHTNGTNGTNGTSDASGTSLAQFDLITLWHSLEHVRSPKQVIVDVVKHLAPGGDLIIAVPNWGGMQARLFGAHWFHLDVPRHLFHFTPQTMSTLLRDVGFAATKTWHMEAELDLFGWTQSALNMVQSEPNVLFDVVTKRNKSHRPLQVATNVALGTALTCAFAPALAPSALLKQGAIMVHAARKIIT